jgi:hypothetical protein
MLGELYLFFGHRSFLTQRCSLAVILVKCLYMKVISRPQMDKDSNYFMLRTDMGLKYNFTGYIPK